MGLPRGRPRGHAPLRARRSMASSAIGAAPAVLLVVLCVLFSSATGHEHGHGHHEHAEHEHGEHEHGEHEHEHENHEKNVHQFTGIIGLGVVGLSIVVKWVQAKRDYCKNHNPIVFEMIQAGLEEFTACGIIILFIVILRQNPGGFDVLGYVSSLPGLEVEHEVIGEAIENIHGLIFLIMFYYFGFVCASALWVTWWVQRDWHQLEEEALTNATARSSSTALYLRLRHAFFNPSVPKCGITKVSSDDFDKQNMNFRKYLAAAVGKNIEQVIALPEKVILIPVVVAFAMYFVWRSVTNGKEDNDTVKDLYMCSLASYSLLLLAGFVSWDVHRLFGQVVPKKIGDAAPFIHAFMGSHPVTNEAYELLSPSEEPLEGAASEVSQGSNARRIARSGAAAGGDGCTKAASRIRSQEDLNAQEALFFFGKNGKMFLLRAIQLLIFGMACLMAGYDKVFSPKLKVEFPLQMAVYCMPFPIVFSLVVHSLFKFTVVVSLELLVDEELASKVIRATKGARLVPLVGTSAGKHLVNQIKYETLLCKYQNMGKLMVRQLMASSEKRATFNALPSFEQAYVRAIFNKHDADQTGFIDEGELAHCLRDQGFNQSACATIAKEWLQVFDVDDSGQLSREEFEVLHMALLQEVHQTAVTAQDCRNIVKKFDKDNNGKFNIGEMKKVLQEWLGISFAKEDILGLFTIICPTGVSPDEIDLSLVAQWLFSNYEMDSKHQAGADEMTNIERQQSNG